MFTQSAFCQSAINSLGETTVGYTLTAARYAVLSWDWYTQTFFSAKAEARYQEIGTIIGTMMVVVFAAGVTARIVVEDLAGDLPAIEEDEEIFADELPGMWEPSDFDFPDFRSEDDLTECRDDEGLPSTSHEDYLDRQMELEALTLKALVPLAADLNLVTRKVRKEVLVEAILKAEGYEA
jgi:hypothetical protein